MQQQQANVLQQAIPGMAPVHVPAISTSAAAANAAVPGGGGELDLDIDDEL